MTIKIYIRNQESLKIILKKFKKYCDKEGIFKEMRKHEFYEKKSEKHARQRRLARKNAQIMTKEDKDNTKDFAI